MAHLFPRLAKRARNLVEMLPICRTVEQPSCLDLKENRSFGTFYWGVAPRLLLWWGSTMSDVDDRSGLALSGGGFRATFISPRSNEVSIRK
jgi:hypothetical protein